MDSPGGARYARSSQELRPPTRPGFVRMACHADDGACHRLGTRISHRQCSCVMRPLRYSINVTLDGCCDHRAILAGEDLHRHAVENLDQADALLFGRVTYEMMEAAWRPPASSQQEQGVSYLSMSQWCVAVLKPPHPCPVERRHRVVPGTRLPWSDTRDEIRSHVMHARVSFHKADDNEIQTVPGAAHARRTNT
jgi:hypothetical protein